MFLYVRNTQSVSSPLLLPEQGVVCLHTHTQILILALSGEIAGARQTARPGNHISSLVPLQRPYTPKAATAHLRRFAQGSHSAHGLMTARQQVVEND